MSDHMIKLEEKVAFLEESVARLQHTVEELNVQVLAMRHEVHNLRRAASPVDEEDVASAAPPPHFRAP